MLGQPISMVLPQVVGYKITGTPGSHVTSTDVVLSITKHLRQVGVVGKFVEFFGPGVTKLSIADRATIANMCPEYGATVGFFPVDSRSLDYLRQTSRDEKVIAYVKKYMETVDMLRDFSNSAQDPTFSSVYELDLSTVVPSLSGPKRPHDRVAAADMKTDFRACLSNPVGFKGFGLPGDKLDTTIPFSFDNKEYVLKHGSVLIAAITSCTNTSNPSVMLGAGMLAKKAVELGLSVAPYIKTSLSPGSGVVTYYLQESGVIPYLETLGFGVVGYGCMTCIGNSGPLPEPVVEAVEKGELVCCGVLSGNRNFEGRIHPHTQANYLASPLFVIAYAIAGRVDIDFETEPLAVLDNGKKVFLRDIWPTRDEIQAVESKYVTPVMFQDVYSKITQGNPNWNKLCAPTSILYPWNTASTYIKHPPFFSGMTSDLPSKRPIKSAHALLHLGDSVTTDHISPAGSIPRNSPAARYLASRGLSPRDFNSFGSRRGNDAVMARGTFGNIRLVNKFIGKATPKTVHIPSGVTLDVFDAAQEYATTNTDLIILAGKDYGCGSSRDWAAKGPFLLGIKAVIAESYERIHRSNLVGMGIVPLQYEEGQTATSLGLSGKEKFDIDIPESLTPGMKISVSTDTGKQFSVVSRFDTDLELTYYKHGGILNYMVRKVAARQ
jgi:aconitate hydratase